MGVNTKTRSRSAALSLSGTRAVTAIETTPPVDEEGIECYDWDQVLLAVSGAANGVADFQIYRRYAGFATSGAPADIWLPGEVIPAMTAKDHHYPLQGSSHITVDTLACDRIEARAVVIPEGVGTLYSKFYGVTRAGNQSKIRGSNERIISTSNFKPVHIQVGHSDFDFVDGGAGNDTLAFTDTADLSGALTIGAKYHVWADQDCYVATGVVTVVATSGDYRLPKSQTREFVPQFGKTFISAVRIATDGNLYISKANDYTSET